MGWLKSIAHGISSAAKWVGHEAAAVGETVADDAFAVGDWALKHGGQSVLDVTGCIPGLNILSNGAEALYHGAHEALDSAEGKDKEATKEYGKAEGYGAMSALNFATGGFGGAALNTVGLFSGKKGIDGAFAGGDYLLDHGGQTVLDGLGLIPGLNVITEGAQSEYHMMHAANNVAEGKSAG